MLSMPSSNSISASIYIRSYGISQVVQLGQSSLPFWPVSPHFIAGSLLSRPATQYRMHLAGRRKQHIESFRKDDGSLVRRIAKEIWSIGGSTNPQP